MKGLILAVSLMLFACQPTSNSTADSKSDTLISRIDSIKKVGADKDDHGCQTTAGYTWSEVKADCIRVFEVGTRLDPVKNEGSAIMSAFVVFDADANRAELFVVNEEHPVILTRETEGGSYRAGDWELFPWKGYVLRYKGENAYVSK